MISIQGLSKVFTSNKSNTAAVDNLTLSIDQGDIFGVIGYSGAGKSTFVRLLNRLEEPTSGRITMNDKEITTLNKRELRLVRQDIGMVFQHFNLLWSRTVADNIAFPLEIAGIPKAERDNRVKTLIELVGLTGKETSYPAQLSGGQKQRVGIARALANKPKVLLCDEATSALDPETTNAILDLLVNINKNLGLTIILITHEMQVIRKICNQVAVMENGKIVEQGNVLDVFLHPKQTVTKKFVKQIMGSDEEDSDISHVMNRYQNGKLIRLHFVGETTNDALISQIIKKYGVDISILQGKITQTQAGAYGTLFIQMDGNEKDMNKAISFVREETSVELEVIHDAN
ncbi:MAG: methionine ABC transporter ATP-binding protein [Bacillota bacterium]|uniref:ATP-binding cassette domain-containing protein n=1 Tax=Virgibacillus salarius TaxID=447199 RepID=A0A941DSQ7_9BACI|nr:MULTISPECIES: ATP-binding cassette domain-containing protein [unclassified Virgibacillus]MBR7794474.1 ATP-binding cassette domain-containing protein [Virgibacillus salarius]MCC2248808.1 ATP-binding cassette domain-containing protein [Virgibacillus sp. AGTR]NAZ07197.1 ATP-binding cassette domain-containing protein [Agaribacter marinus]QRZ17903.1 ATP-binding cassette domain-containing protein [Virgibacillus sp. AGTR]